jgi:hypothetical protein
MKTIRSIRAIATPLAFALAAAIRPAAAAWDIVPVVSLTAESDDNVRLDPGDQPTSTRTAVDARLRITDFSEKGEAFIEPRIVADAYADDRDESLENTDLFLRTHARRTLERASFEFNSDYRNQSVLRSEFDDALDDELGIGDLDIETDAGTVGPSDDERERFALAMQGGYELSDRTILGLETQWIDVGYSNPAASARSDFDSATLGMSLTRSVDERNDMIARIYGTDYSAARNDNESQSLGVEATFLRPLTETLSFSLQVGVVRTEFSFIDSGTDRTTGTSNGFTFGFDVEKRTEQTTFTVSAGRSVSPSTLGFLAPRDDIALSVRHRVTPRIRISGGLRAAEIDVTSGASAVPRDYFRATLEVDWQLNQRWTVLGGYDRVSEQFGSGAAGEAESNAIFAGIRFQGMSRR